MKKIISFICILLLLVSCKHQNEIDSQSIEHIEGSTTDVATKTTKTGINSSDYELSKEEKVELLKEMENDKGTFLRGISSEDKAVLANEYFDTFKVDYGYSSITDMLQEGQTIEKWFDENAYSDYFWQKANEKLDLLKYININYKRNIDGSIKEYPYLVRNEDINSMANREILLELLKNYYISGGDSILIDKKEQLMYQNGLDRAEMNNIVLDDIMYFYGDKIDKKLLNKEYTLLDLASKCEEYLGYRESFFNVKTTGKTGVFNEETNSFEDNYYDIDYYLDKTIAEIKEKYPDITNTTMLTDEEKADEEYIRRVLNLNDFGDYKNAFFDCDLGFCSNSLTGKFNNDVEKQKTYDEFCKLDSLKEKAEYIRRLVLTLHLV